MIALGIIGKLYKDISTTEYMILYLPIRWHPPSITVCPKLDITPYGLFVNAHPVSDQVLAQTTYSQH